MASRFQGLPSLSNVSSEKLALPSEGQQQRPVSFAALPPASVREQPSRPSLRSKSYERSSMSASHIRQTSSHSKKALKTRLTQSISTSRIDKPPPISSRLLSREFSSSDQLLEHVLGTPQHDKPSEDILNRMLGIEDGEEDAHTIVETIDREAQLLSLCMHELSHKLSQTSPAEARYVNRLQKRFQGAFSMVPMLVLCSPTSASASIVVC